jgi:tRNA 2-thiouridine synthesizing protein D
MPVQLCLILQKSISEHLYSERALRFAQQAIAAGQQINCVFFYRSAVNHAKTELSGSAQALQQKWQSWSTQQQVPLIVCHTVAERMGLSDFAPGYQDAGLTALVQAMASADRTLQF